MQRPPSEGDASSLKVHLKTLGERIELAEWILDSMAGGVMLARWPDSTIVYANHKFEEIYGYGRGELTGKRVSILRDADSTVAEAIRSLPMGGEWQGEIPSVKKDGSRFIAGIRVSRAVHPQHGDVWVALHTDISARKRAEAALKEVNDLYSTLIRTAGGVLVAFAPDFKIVEFNHAAEMLYGVVREDALGRNYLETFVPAEERARVAADVGKVLSGVSTTGFECLARRFDGAKRLVVWNVNRHLDADGNPAGVIAVGQDVTEKKAVERALREKSMYLDNILRSSTEFAIATTDLDFRITYYNPLAEKFHGYKAEDAIGKTVQEIHTKEKVAPERFEKAIENIKRTGEHCYVIEKVTDSGAVYIEARVSGIYDSENNLVGFANFSRDVTARRQAEAERMKLIEDLKAALDNVKTLKGLIPICASCKKIRDDSGFWTQLESYISKHSDADFTHGFCPECAKKLIDEAKRLSGKE